MTESLRKSAEKMSDKGVVLINKLLAILAKLENKGVDLSLPTVAPNLPLNVALGQEHSEHTGGVLGFIRQAISERGQGLDGDDLNPRESCVHNRAKAP